MKAAKKARKKTKERRTDGRKAMLVYMRPRAHRGQSKDAAEAGDEKAWQLVERAVVEGSEIGRSREPVRGSVEPDSIAGETQHRTSQS